MFFDNFTNRMKRVFTGKPVRLVVQYDICNVNIDLCKNNELGITSKTFYQLQKPLFVLDNNYDDNGFRLTTLIDRKTGGVVTAFVAKAEPNDGMLKDCKTEEYWILVEDNAGEVLFNNKQYSIVGDIYFQINKEQRMVMPKFELVNIKGALYEKVCSYMKAPGNKDYAGIGTRLHQIRIERMLQDKLGNSYIVAEGNSFPFHYSMGYRLKPVTRPIEDSIGILQEFSSWNNKSFKENLKYLFAEEQDNKYVINWSATLEHCLCDYYKNGGATLEEFLPNMYLNETSVKQWIEMIQKQPILMNKER